MFRYVADIHRSVLTSVHLTDEVTVERPEPDGTWTVIGTYAAQVQHRREFPSPDDPDQATTLERDTLRVYMLPESNARRGDRVMWDGNAWVVASATRARSTENYRRVDLEQQTDTAMAPIDVVVNRRESGAWIEVGTFTVRRILDSRDPIPQGRISVYEAFTASGAVYTGVLIGDATFDVVQVGDWFTSDDLPGRITSIDRSDPARIEASFQQEARGV